MKPAHTYHWLLFDADGTLFDYDLAEAKALEGTFHNFKLPFHTHSADTYRLINRQVWDDFEKGQISAEVLRTARFERLFEALKINAPGKRQSVLDFSRQYLQNLAQAGDLIPGAFETLETLRKKYRLGIITNGLQDVQRPRLAASGIAAFFDVISISDELGVAKPDPRFFQQTFEHMGRPPRETVLVIGDSLSSDIQGGNQSGLDTCWFNPTGSPSNPSIPATFEIRNLTELIDLL